MAFLKKGLLGKMSLVSIFLFFILSAALLVNMALADNTVFSFDKQFSCQDCENLVIPSEAEVDVSLNISFVHFKDEDEKINLIELVPPEWEILDSDGGTVSNTDFFKTIEWDVNLEEYGEKYNSDDYKIIEVQKKFSVMSPSVGGLQSFNFISRTDKDIGSVEVTVDPSIAKIGKEPEVSKAVVISSTNSGDRYLKRIRTNKVRKVYTDIPERLAKEGYSIKLYRIRGSIRDDVTNDSKYNTSFIDSDSNGAVDRIEWEADDSDDMFEIEAYIEIINVQSYPVVGGNWTVKFTTKDTADLKITAINGTTFGESVPDDLKFLELRCGERVFSPALIGNSIIYKNYYCNGTGYETSKVLTAGNHYLEFDFGGQKAYASNDADVFETGRVETNGWTTVNLKRTYTNPVVIVGPVEGYETSADLEVSQAVVRNISPTYFEVQLYNETNGALAGNVSYIVVENGTHMLSNGMLLQAGRVDGVSSYGANGDNGAAYQSITFWEPYSSDPSVVASPQNDSAQDWVGIRWQSLTTTGISLSLEIDNSYGTGPIAASSVGSGENNAIGWIAINRTSASDMEGNIELNVDNDPGATGGWQPLTFSNTYTEPVFFAIEEESGGTDPCIVGRQNLVGTGVDIRQTEERTDGEQDHADTEDDMWVVFESGLGNGPPTAPTDIECDGSSNCNITVNTGVSVNASNSTDSSGDAITYFIEASLENVTETDDQESGEVGFFGEQITVDYNGTVTDLNPEARWLLNGDGTDSADGHDDLGGNLPSFVSSIIPNAPTEYCGDFDGSADELHIPDAPEINNGGGYAGTERAISVWIVADTIDTSGNGRGIWTEGGATNSLNMYVYDNGTSTNLYCNAVEGGGTPQDWVAYPIETGVLYHVGCMFDFAGGRIDMYINGTLVDSDTSLAVGTALSSHGNNNALGGVDQNTISHTGASISGNFDGRIADLVYWSDGSVITQENFTAIYEAGAGIGGSTDIDATKDWQTYSDILENDWKNITEINVTVYVSTYDNLGSGLNGNDYPDLQLEMATSDSSDWTEVGNFSVDGTGNFTLTTTDSTILNTWLDKEVSDLRIRGVDFDYNDPSNYDKINFTGLWVGVDGVNWISLGNHSNETLIEWNTTDIAEQNCVDFRTRAADLDGSGGYSSYFTKGACLNISHADSTPPKWYENLTSVASSSQYIEGRQYQFNVTWNDSDTSVDKVLIENNFSGGSPANETVTTNDGDVYYFDISDLAAGTYVWREFANNTDGFWNVTNSGDYWVYVISKNSSTQDFMNLTIGTGTSGAEENYQDTYPVTTNATGWYSSILDNQDITFTLYRNDTTLGSANPQSDVVQMGTGLYMYVYNTSGNENYTSSSKQLNLTVQQNTTNPVDLYFVNSTGDFINQNMTVSYEEQTNVTGFNVYPNSGTVHLFRDEVNVTDTEYDQWMTLGYNSGGYVYKINTSGNENYSANDTGATYYIIVNKKQTETYLWINDTRANYGLTASESVNFTVELSGYPGRTVELWSNYSDGVWRLWDSGSSPIENITQMTSIGKFGFLGNYSDDENYTYSEETWILTVSSISLDAFLESMSPTSINQSQNSTVVGNCSCDIGTCNNVYIEIQADGNPIPSTSGGDLQVNGSSSYSLGQLSGSWASRSWNISGWIPGTYSITIMCNSTETGNSFSSTENLEVNDTEYPTWSGNTTSPLTGVDYEQGNSYQFNVTWNDNKEVDTVLIENNFSGGSPTNDTVSANGGNEYYYYVNDLPAGNYVWREFANDTTDNWNVTDSWTFTVDKSPTDASLYLNGSTSNQISYYPNSTINATAISNVSGLYVQLWRNGTLLSNTTSLSFDVTQWSAWNNNFTVQVLGNENYTSSSPVYLWWNVSKGFSPLMLEINDSWSVKYPIATNVTASGCPSEITCSLYRNDTGLIGSVEDSALLGAGGYEYIYNTSGGENYSSNSTSNILEVVKGDAYPVLSINTSWTETYPTATNVSCSVSSLNNEVSCSLYRNDMGSVSNPDENLLGGGVYEYVANTSETSNYSANSTGDVMTLTIETYPFTDVDLFLNGTQGNYEMNFDSGLNVTAVLDNPGSGNISVWTNYSDGVWKLWDSCSDCSSLQNESFITDSGYWNFTANYSGNQNYSPSYESWYIDVKDVIPPFYSSNSTNSTGAGTAIEHRLEWEDNVGLSGYVFRFCNGTWNGTYCLGAGAGLNYNDSVMGLNPSYRWLLDGNGNDFFGLADGSGTMPNWVDNIIPNNDTAQCGDYTGSQVINIPGMDNINEQDTYNKSISVWIVADTIDTAGNGRIIWEEGGATNSMALYVLNDGGRDQIFFSAVESSSYDYVNYSLDEGSLAHIGATLDTSAGEMHLYINGTLVDSKTGSLNIGPFLNSHGDDPGIGGLNSAADRHDGAALSGGFDGRIADLVYWGETSHVLNETDFNNIYQAGIDPGGNWETDEWQPFSGYPGWSNVTKVVNSTDGSSIAWCVYANDSSDNWNYSSCDNPFSYTAETLGHLEVELITPPGNTIVDDYVNFTVNATVYCRDGKCGDVYGTVRYNLTSPNPDTPINTTFGDEPFFINETPASATKNCMDDMQQDNFCNVTWVLNATGTDTEWKMGVLFNSSYLGLDNTTDNVTITIVPCIEEMSLHFSGVDFGSIIPSTDGNDALGNMGNNYNITNSGSCISNIWMKATNLVNNTDEINYANISFNNITNDYGSSYRFSDNYGYGNSTLKSNVPGSTNVTSYYFLNVPAVYAKKYVGNITICMNSTEYEEMCE